MGKYDDISISGIKKLQTGEDYGKKELGEGL